MRIYIIGPVSGFDDLNFSAFENARRLLADADYQTLLPHDFVPSDATWQRAMRISLETLAKADGVACLPGWSKSYGANLEFEIAKSLGIPVMHVDDWLRHEIAAEKTALAKNIKFCPRCKREIPFLMFDKSASSSDGRQSYCRDCMNGYRRDWRNHESA